MFVIITIPGSSRDREGTKSPHQKRREREEGARCAGKEVGEREDFCVGQVQQCSGCHGWQDCSCRGQLDIIYVYHMSSSIQRFAHSGSRWFHIMFAPIHITTGARGSSRWRRQLRVHQRFFQAGSDQHQDEDHRDAEQHVTCQGQLPLPETCR